MASASARANVTCVLEAGASLGECPVWDPADQSLYWIDIERRVLHRFDPKTEIDEVRSLPQRPGSIALTQSPGRLLVAMEHRLAFYHWEADSFEEWVVVETPGEGIRLNDGRCDPAGRFWVGSMYEDPSAGRFEGSLHRVEPDGAATVIRREVGVSNGLAFSPDGRTMYWADTLHDTVWQYDFDPATGVSSNERVFIDFSHQPGRPDGACVDSEGCYWIACVFGWALARFTPRGELDRIIELPVEAPTMPAFGGPGLATIYVTSISDGGSRATESDQPYAGGLLAVDAGVAGLPEPRFAG